MNLKDIDDFLSKVERHQNQKFRFRTELAWLMGLVTQRTMEHVFDDILFFSKFLTHASMILKREGTGSDAIENLKKEFSLNFEKNHTLLRTLVKESEEPARAEFVSRFLTMSPESVENLLALAKELTWIKNYNLDHQHQ